MVVLETKRRCDNNKITVICKLTLTSSNRTYNKETQIQFLSGCESSSVSTEFVIDNENILKGTVRNLQNMVSRFWQIPSLFIRTVYDKHYYDTINSSIKDKKPKNKNFHQFSRKVFLARLILPICQRINR